MTDTKTPDQVTENYQEPKQPSDARIILGPLVKYAAIGLVLVGIIVTTAVMLDRQFNNIDQEVAALQAQLANANEQAEAVSKKKTDAAPITDTVDAPVSEVSVAQTAVAVSDATAAQIPAVAEAPEVIQADKLAADNTGSTSPVAVTQPAAQVVAPVLVTETVADTGIPAEATVGVRTIHENDFFGPSMDEIIAERNTYLKERDRIYLEEFRQSQQKRLQTMRDRLVRQEQRIEERKQRYQEIYDIRAANMKERQEIRESFLTDRI